MPLLQHTVIIPNILNTLLDSAPIKALITAHATQKYAFIKYYWTQNPYANVNNSTSYLEDEVINSSTSSKETYHLSNVFVVEMGTYE